MWPRKEHIYRNASVFTTFMLLRSLLCVCVYTFVQCLIAHCYDSSRLQLPFITLMMVTLKRKLKPVNLKHLAISSHESVMERCCVKCLDAYLYYISACCDTPFASREPSQWRILWKHKLESTFKWRAEPDWYTYDTIYRLKNFFFHFRHMKHNRFS